ncbi:MAG: hypothetical protein N3G22_00580 [Candidatus Micrarchaeota archaeon]|nr:hypothetical protein [Candidatus Micrarchaeota archaeon]
MVLLFQSFSKEVEVKVVGRREPPEEREVREEHLFDPTFKGAWDKLLLAKKCERELIGLINEAKSAEEQVALLERMGYANAKAVLNSLQLSTFEKQYSEVELTIKRLERVSKALKDPEEFAKAANALASYLLSRFTPYILWGAQFGKMPDCQSRFNVLRDANTYLAYSKLFNLYSMQDKINGKMEYISSTNKQLEREYASLLPSNLPQIRWSSNARFAEEVANYRKSLERFNNAYLQFEQKQLSSFLYRKKVREAKGIGDKVYHAAEPLVTAAPTLLAVAALAYPPTQLAGYLYFGKDVMDSFKKESSWEDKVHGALMAATMAAPFFAYVKAAGRMLSFIGQTAGMSAIESSGAALAAVGKAGMGISSLAGKFLLIEVGTSGTYLSLNAEKYGLSPDDVTNLLVSGGLLGLPRIVSKGVTGLKIKPGEVTGKPRLSPAQEKYAKAMDEKGAQVMMKSFFDFFLNRLEESSKRGEEPALVEEIGKLIKGAEEMSKESREKFLRELYYAALEKSSPQVLDHIKSEMIKRGYESIISSAQPIKERRPEIVEAPDSRPRIKEDWEYAAETVERIALGRNQEIARLAKGVFEKNKNNLSLVSLVDEVCFSFLEDGRVIEILDILGNEGVVAALSKHSNSIAGMIAKELVQLYLKAFPSTPFEEIKSRCLRSVDLLGKMTIEELVLFLPQISTKTPDELLELTGKRKRFLNLLDEWMGGNKKTYFELEGMLTLSGHEVRDWVDVGLKKKLFEAAKKEPHLLRLIRKLAEGGYPFTQSDLMEIRSIRSGRDVGWRLKMEVAKTELSIAKENPNIGEDALNEIWSTFPTKNKLILRLCNVDGGKRLDELILTSRPELIAVEWITNAIAKKIAERRTALDYYYPYIEEIARFDLDNGTTFAAEFLKNKALPIEVPFTIYERLKAKGLAYLELKEAIKLIEKNIEKELVGQTKEKHDGALIARLSLMRSVAQYSKRFQTRPVVELQKDYFSEEMTWEMNSARQKLEEAMGKSDPASIKEAMDGYIKSICSYMRKVLNKFETEEKMKKIDEMERDLLEASSIITKSEKNMAPLREEYAGLAADLLAPSRITGDLALISIILKNVLKNAKTTGDMGHLLSNIQNIMLPQMLFAYDLKKQVERNSVVCTNVQSAEYKELIPHLRKVRGDHPFCVTENNGNLYINGSDHSFTYNINILRRAAHFEVSYYVSDCLGTRDAEEVPWAKPLTKKFVVGEARIGFNDPFVETMAEIIRAMPTERTYYNKDSRQTVDRVLGVPLAVADAPTKWIGDVMMDVKAFVEEGKPPQHQIGSEAAIWMVKAANAEKEFREAYFSGDYALLEAKVDGVFGEGFFKKACSFEKPGEALAYITKAIEERRMEFEVDPDNLIKEIERIMYERRGM